MDNGAKLKKFGALVQAFVEENGTDEAMSEFVTPLADLGDKVTKLTMEIGMKAMQNQDEVGAAAVPYLRVVGHLVYSYFFARMAKIALAKLESGDNFYKAKLATARFYFARLLPETAMLIRQARSGAKPLLDLEAELFLMLLVMQDNPLRIQHAKSKLKARPSHPPLAGRLLVSSLRSTVSSRCERIV
jgi:hypothetical protein